MDNLHPASPGNLAWGTFQDTNMPTPISHNLVDYSMHLDVSEYHNNDSAINDSAPERHVERLSNPSSQAYQPDQSTTDTTMVDSEPAPPAEGVVRRPKEPVAASRRPKQVELNWDGNREVLHKLYIQEGRTLIETMKAMKELYDFEAP